jgi:hypothetical protein
MMQIVVEILEKGGDHGFMAVARDYFTLYISMTYTHLTYDSRTSISSEPVQKIGRCLDTQPQYPIPSL